MNEETDWGDYESGPFCRHWSDYDCEVVCARCGHRCTHHSIGNDEECNEPGCDCPGWVEPGDEDLIAEVRE